MTNNRKCSELSCLFEPASTTHQCNPSLVCLAGSPGFSQKLIKCFQRVKLPNWYVIKCNSGKDDSLFSLSVASHYIAILIQKKSRTYKKLALLLNCQDWLNTFFIFRCKVVFFLSKTILFISWWFFQEVNFKKEKLKSMN